MRSQSNPWPQWPRIFGVDYGHAEVISVFGEDPRTYSVMTTEFRGENGVLKSLVTCDVKILPGGRVERVPNSEKEWPCDLAILAMGFVSPESSIVSQLRLEVDQRNNIHAHYGDYLTSVEGVFAAGDCRRGQSLVVWAINEGRGVADACHKFLENQMVKRQQEEEW
jgi:NADPH-dependent glutamate synthase beta subunit-like oxidoreductase